MGNFSLETRTKSTIAHHYFTDANEWLEIYEQSPYRDPRKSMRAKSFVNLLFAFECYLKSFSLCFSKRSQKAKPAYNTLKKKSHSLVKLDERCTHLTQGKYRIITPGFRKHLETMDNLGVNLRYDLDLKVGYKKQSFKEWLSGTGPVSQITDQNEFIESAYLEAKKMQDRTKKALKRRFSKHIGGSGTQMGQVNDNLRDFINK